MVNSLSKYQNQIQGSTTVSPAKFGKLTLEEYDSNGNLVSDNNSETLDLADISSINKRVELKYTKGDIKSLRVGKKYIIPKTSVINFLSTALQ